jgi:tetratricopeptide (TPR) repeat protein
VPRAGCLVLGAALLSPLPGTRGIATSREARPATRDLTGIDALVRVYDAILDARFDEAGVELKRACAPAGPAPREACDVLAATRTWWRIQLDPASRESDAAFSAEVERAIASTEAWSRREPRNAEAHFYTGGAYAARVQWRVLRGERVAAARDGKRIKAALERAADLDPALEDAYFGIGLYQYYADVAPAAAKFLRFLLLLPGGNKTEGLARMRRTHANGKLLQGEADYQLQIVYLWYERRADLAIDLLESLRDRYPGNPIFAAQLADVQERYQHDLMASLATWRALLAAATSGKINEGDLAETEARLGMARNLEAIAQTDAAREHLRAVIDARPPRPVGALAAAYLALGEGEDRLGHRDAALAAYRLAFSTAPAVDGGGIRDRAAEHTRHAPDATRAEAYRLALEGWRKLEQGNPRDAETLLAHAVTLEPDDPVARYRHARALQASRDETAALAEYDAALELARDAPAPIAAAAFLDAARLEERHARRDQAIAHYRAASTWFGGGADTRAAALRALQRLHAQK